ncbi:DUF6455 family protein [Anianabacter salinae]|uniref:DUF6455 family protein n=1 Tax=Anianabacter salinae TaxID=2851023 RepID=UPI00225E3ACF|nr:DUF6455 family protein [Anianabacter salinae]
MSIMEKLNRRSSLVNRMADTVGVDMAEQMMRAHVSPDEVRGAVFRCMSCRQDQTCEAWMDAHPQGAAAAPGYCRNGEMLARLATG